MSTSQINPKEEKKLQRESFDQKPLGKNNYMLMIAAGVMIVVGFLLMLGSSSGDGGFNPDIFSTRRIVVGPAITFLGFVGMAVAVWVKPRK